jgi:hypothetical protein
MFKTPWLEIDGQENRFSQEAAEGAEVCAVPVKLSALCELL